MLERRIAAVASSHRGLESMLDGLAAAGELDVAAPSQLPGWTVGHVLAHVARNADSIVRVLDASERGEVVERYLGGSAGRAAGIDAGAGRPVGEQVADVHASDARLEAAFAGHANWDGQSQESSGQLIPVRDLVFQRWREVEVHRADLGLGYGSADWPPEYVRTDLVMMEMRWNARCPMGLTGLPAAARAVPEHVRLAWLLGRTEIPCLPPAAVF